MQAFLDAGHLAFELAEANLDEAAAVAALRRPAAQAAAHARGGAVDQPWHEIGHVRRASGVGSAAAELRTQEPAGALVAELHGLHEAHFADAARAQDLAGAQAPRVEATVVGDGVDDAQVLGTLREAHGVGAVHDERLVDEHVHSAVEQRVDVTGVQRVRRRDDRERESGRSRQVIDARNERCPVALRERMRGVARIRIEDARDRQRRVRDDRRNVVAVREGAAAQEQDVDAVVARHICMVSVIVLVR